MKATKIPHAMKAGPSTAFGIWVVFAGLTKCGPAFEALKKKKKLPVHGKVQVKGKIYWFCLKGAFDLPYIYTNTKKNLIKS